MISPYVRPVLALVAFAAPALARAEAPPAPRLAEPLQPLAFLLGRWEGQGKSPAGPSEGTFRFRALAGGRVLVREHRATSARGVHEDVLVIVADPNGRRSAFYASSEGRTIHFDEVTTPEPGLVVFLSQGDARHPAFRLTYRLKDTHTVAVEFAIRPPGSDTFQPYAEGTARRR